MLETLTREAFLPHVNQTFRMQVAPGEAIDVELIEVRGTTPMSAAEGAPRRAPFALLFRGPQAPVCPQRIYRLAHGEMDAFEIFLVPIASDGSGTRYEAVFG
jgi:hypothetical protein